MPSERSEQRSEAPFLGKTEIRALGTIHVEPVSNLSSLKKSIFKKQRFILEDSKWTPGIFTKETVDIRRALANEQIAEIIKSDPTIHQLLGFQEQPKTIPNIRDIKDSEATKSKNDFSRQEI